MKRRILAVDDSEINRHYLRKILESEGFDVETASDGRSAWESLLARVRSERTAQEILKLKNAPEEIGYLGLLQRSPKLRASILRASAGES